MTPEQVGKREVVRRGERIGIIFVVFSKGAIVTVSNRDMSLDAIQSNHAIQSLRYITIRKALLFTVAESVENGHIDNRRKVVQNGTTPRTVEILRERIFIPIFRTQRGKRNLDLFRVVEMEKIPN